MLEAAPWAVNGALIDSSLARRAQYAAVQGAEGIVSVGDFAVSPLSVPGQGVRISPGVGLVLNRYMNNPSELYVVSNPDVHIIPANEMPAVSTSAKSYMLSIVIGDPDFSQVSHPFMTSSLPAAGTERDFQYSRLVFTSCSPGATTITGNFPHLDIARIDVPANTTTINSSMIKRVSRLAAPRSSQVLLPWRAWSAMPRICVPIASNYTDITSQHGLNQKVTVPTWATRAIVDTDFSGLRVDDTNIPNIYGALGVRVGSKQLSGSFYDLPQSVGATRHSFHFADVTDVTSMRGQAVDIVPTGYQSGPANMTGANDRYRLNLVQANIFTTVSFFEE